jgi:hypothetical protein
MYNGKLRVFLSRGLMLEMLWKGDQLRVLTYVKLFKF